MCSWLIIFNLLKASFVVVFSSPELLSWVSIRHPSVIQIAEQISTKLAINVHWMVIYQICVFFVLIWNPTWLPGSIMCSHWLKFKKSSCQKPPSQLNCDFAGMIIGWSCTKLVNRLPIGNSRWLPWLDLVLT